jgi:uncharacterized protein YoxC
MEQNMTMMDIFSLILMGAASLLCIALVFFVVKLSSTFKGFDDSIKQLSEQLKPLTASLTGFSKRLNGIADELQAPLNATINVFLQLKERVDLVLNVEEDIRETIVNQVSAVVNGIKSFAGVYKGNGHIPKRSGIFRS